MSNVKGLQSSKLKRNPEHRFLGRYSAVCSALFIALGMTPVYADEAQECQQCEAGAAVGNGGTRTGTSLLPNRLAALPPQSERELPKERLILWEMPAGTPIAQNVIRIKEEERVVETREASTPVRFASGYADIPKEFLTRLETALEELKDKQNLRVRVTGHTDEQRLSARAAAKFGDNYGLGMHRAKEVGAVFVEALDLTSEQIEYASEGPDSALLAGRSAEAWQKNRRVEVELWYDEVTTHTAQVEEIQEGGTLTCPAGTRPSLAEVPFQVSIDGVAYQRDAVSSSADEQRCVDVALERDAIQLQYDNLSSLPKLNIAAVPRTAKVGETVEFVGYSNYLHWIEKAEVRIYGRENRWGGNEELAIVPLANDLSGTFLIDVELPETLYYTLRVYDAEGRYDETLVKRLVTVVDNEAETAEEQVNDKMAIYGVNALQRHTIPVSGGTITVNGKDIAAGHDVYVMGKAIPKDDKGAFVSQQIIPRGLHTIEVAVLDDAGKGKIYRRDLRLPNRDWFVVGMVDVTIGEQNTTGPAQLATGEERDYDDDSYIDGRISFYARGELDDNYRVTASMDTGEEAIDSLFSNFNEKDPRDFLRRVDSNRSWGTFGDDSVLVEEAPTRGKFYVKVEDVKSHVMWGNFDQQDSQTELTQVDRRLYGLQGVYQSDGFTAFGDRKLKVSAFAAEPGTAHAREEFLGTGGSLYFLRNQDITSGSESIRVEVRDADSGLVIDARYLTYGLDYDIDSLQGRVYLTRPLSSLTESDSPVRNGSSLGGNPVYLVVNYEYSPGFSSSDDIAVGGRISGWVNDKLQLGVTLNAQENAGERQELGGVDLTYRHTEETWVRLESAQSDGAGIDQFSSFDGGFGFNSETVVSDDSRANRVAVNLNLEDLAEDWQGNLSAYFEDRDAGFAGPGRFTRYDTRQYGMRLDTALTERTDMFVKLDDTDETGGNAYRSGDLGLGYALTESWDIVAGYRTEKRESQVGFNGGSRDDVALQLEYAPEDQDWSTYGFVQGTVNRTGDRERNNRVGLGGSYRLNNRTQLLGELSDGNLGLGAKLGVDYAASERTSVYMNYALDNDRADFGGQSQGGQLVSGARSRVTDSTSVYTEQRYQHGSQLQGLVQGYGLDFAPSDTWSYGLTTEFGTLRGDGDLEIKRKASSGKVAYETTELRYSTVLEYREDESANDTRTVWLTRNSLVYKVSDNWRLLGRYDQADSDSSQGAFFDGNFTEASLGYAYRPVTNDRLNALVKLTYLADLAPPDQISASGRRVDYSQKSYVAAADAIFDLNEHWSIGGRFAFRKGELRQSRDESAQWFSSIGRLLAVRVDYRIVREWDVMVELRDRSESQALDSSTGFVVAAHRHFGNNFKAGIGYNFTDFSEDLTDLNYRSDGWFLNMTGKF